MIVRTFTPNKDEIFRTPEPNKAGEAKSIKVTTLSIGYNDCSRDMRSMCDKLDRLLAVVRDWSNDATLDIAIALDKALEETIKRIQRDVDSSLRENRIEDEHEKSYLTMEITNLINQAKALISIIKY